VNIVQGILKFKTLINAIFQRTAFSLMLKPWNCNREINGSRGFRGPPPPSPEIHHQMLVKLEIWDPKYVNVLLFRGVPPFLERSPFRNFWIPYWMGEKPLLAPIFYLTWFIIELNKRISVHNIIINIALTVLKHKIGVSLL
jgi:hypothetical protein